MGDMSWHLGSIVSMDLDVVWMVCCRMVHAWRWWLSDRQTAPKKLDTWCVEVVW